MYSQQLLLQMKITLYINKMYAHMNTSCPPNDIFKLIILNQLKNKL